MIYVGYMLVDPNGKPLWWISNIELFSSISPDEFDYPGWDDLVSADPDDLWKPIDEFREKLEKSLFSIEERVELDWWDTGRKHAIMLYRLRGYGFARTVVDVQNGI